VAARGKGKGSGMMAGVGSWLKALCMVGVGLVGGYVWRSYAPLPLPFESPLVADKSSDDVATAQLRELAKSANERADMEAREREALAARRRDIENDRRAAEANLGDMQIRTIIKGSE